MKRRHPEDEIQKAVFDHIRMRAMPGLVAWHTPNGAKLGGKRNSKGIPIQAARLKGLGVRSGIPDLLALKDGKLFAMEIKAPGGKLTEAQEQMLIDLRAAGATACHCHGLDQ